MRRRRPAHIQERVRHVFRRDKDEASIIRALELAGWTVITVNSQGVPDLLCARKGELRIIEVKSEGGSLTPSQKVTHRRLAAAGVVVPIVRTPLEALELVGAPEYLREHYRTWRPTPVRPRKPAPAGAGGHRGPGQGSLFRRPPTPAFRKGAAP